MKLYKILASVPADATASKVTSKGYEYEPDVNITQEIWDRPPEGMMTYKMGVTLGTVKGRLTVVGKLRTGKNTKRGATYVVRCTCGKYTVRKAKSLSNPRNEDDCCEYCRQLNHLKWKYRIKKYENEV